MLDPAATSRRVRPLAVAILLGVGIMMTLPVTAPADEGMWVFNNLPLKRLKERHGFEPSQPWINHLRSSAVRFNSGGSGSFVSADGLVMTNHHVGADCLAKISTQEKDYMKTGFEARSGAEAQGEVHGQQGDDIRHRTARQGRLRRLRRGERRGFRGQGNGCRRARSVENPRRQGDAVRHWRGS